MFNISAKNPPYTVDEEKLLQKRDKLEKKVIDREKLIEDILKCAPYKFISLNKNLKVLFFNHPPKKILQRPSREVKGKNIMEMLHADLHPPALKIVEKNKKGSVHKQDLSCYNKKGSYEVLNLLYSFIFDETPDLKEV